MTVKSVYEINEFDRKRWYLNHQLHREDGPAVEYPDGFKAWWLNGKLHREDGPAIEYPDGVQSWYLHDNKLYPGEAVNDPELQAKYPKLIESMIIYLVHEL